jgi:hypothetical protein
MKLEIASMKQKGPGEIALFSIRHTSKVVPMQVCCSNLAIIPRLVPVDPRLPMSG